MGADRWDRLVAIRHSPREIAAKTSRIYASIVSDSAEIRSGNFEAIGVEDLESLFRLYDAEFFDGLLASLLREAGAGPVKFRLASRMTSAGGKTFLRRTRGRGLFRWKTTVELEIAVSTFLLFQTFARIDRPVTVSGLACRDRLEALQRIFEHELLHLAEFLAVGRSSCKAEPFHRLSLQVFGHLGVVHDLVTPREVAATTLAIKGGDWVKFDHDGVERIGRVNRITKRATILVEDPAGRAFTDGKRYATFYVPLHLLRKLGEPLDP